MRFLQLKFSFLLGCLLGSSLLFAEEIVIDLKDPTYCEGTLTTEKGGVLKKGCLRIQAQKITYKNKKSTEEEVSKVCAEGNLMILYKNRLFVGQKIEYDFASNTGLIHKGKLISDPWFTGGETIFLRCDGSFEVLNGYLTTCEEEDCDFFIQSHKICVKPNKFASLQDIKFYFFKIPLFWVPSYTANLNCLDDIPIQFRVKAGGYKKTRFTAKYKLFSGIDWKAFLRLDFTLARGLGGGLETQYCSAAESRSFETSSYAARDVSFDDPKKRTRYRFQGRYDEFFRKEDITAHMTYDVLSDSEMASDYSYIEFELPTGKRTELYVTKKTKNSITDFSSRVRVNNFQTVNQLLPSIEGSYRPFVIGATGIISDNRVRTEYLNYSYMRGTPVFKDFQSARVEIHPRLYRPFYRGPFTITPELGFIGVFYGNNPHGNPVYQAIGNFSVDANAHFYRYFGRNKHILEPYLQYEFLTSPSTSFKNQFIFDINDGFARLNMLRLGLVNNIYCHDASGRPYRWVWVDIWANAFFGTPQVGTFIPKIYGRLNWKVCSCLTTTMCTAWNNTSGRPDYSNLSLAWTVSEDFAFTMEYLARGPRDWRKADQANFILDSFRSIAELEASPLSDRRNTFLTHFFYRFHPDWTLELQTRNGWNRRNQPSYVEYNLNLTTVLKCSWILRLGYEHRTIEDRYTFGINLGKHVPKWTEPKSYGKL